MLGESRKNKSSPCNALRIPLSSCQPGNHRDCWFAQGRPQLSWRKDVRVKKSYRHVIKNNRKSHRQFQKETRTAISISAVSAFCKLDASRREEGQGNVNVCATAAFTSDLLSVGMNRSPARFREFWAWAQRGSPTIRQRQDLFPYFPIFSLGK